MLAILLFAQAAALDPLMVERGASIYAQRCSVPYCHGPAGTSGRAPALARRKFEIEQWRRIISQGISSRGMPGFHQQLGDEGVNAVLAYIRSLPGSPVPHAPQPAANTPKLTKAAAEGRDLFFDSSRLPGCSDCHAVGSMGAAVAAKLTASITIDAIRGVRSTHVQTARVQGEPAFPAIIGQVTSDTMRVYDLSTPLPVLRSYPKAAITLEERSKWDHAAVVKRYSDAELELILAFIKAK